MRIISLLLFATALAPHNAFVSPPPALAVRGIGLDARRGDESPSNGKLIREYTPSEGYKTLVPNLLLFFTVLQLPELALRIPQYNACVAESGRAACADYLPLFDFLYNAGLPGV